MNARRFFLVFSFSLCLLSPLVAKNASLSSTDVREVMDQLFDYHIDKKEMTPLIIERSLKIYVNHFDPNYTYLLQEEAFPYLRPTQKLLRTILREYHKDSFTIFFTLNATIQQSILRARAWRRVWEQNPIQLVNEAKQVNLEENREKHFASEHKELKQRHYDYFLRFLAFQMRQLNYPSFEEKEEKLVTLCEKQMTLLENSYLGVDDQGKELSLDEHESQVILLVLKSLAQSLDAHTSYYSPDEAHIIKVQLEKGMCGIGVVLREGIDGIAIAEIVNASPAQKCGQLEVGDTIVEVDGEVIEGLSFHHVLEIMRGKEGTKIVLGIIRQTPQEPHFLRVGLTRSKITIEDKRVDVEAEPFGLGYIGKITLHSFYEGEDGLSSEKDLRRSINELQAAGPLYGLVLDMRENTGGFLSQAIRVSGLFISNGVVVISKYSDGSVKYYRSVDGSRFYDGPLVILTSRSSASATEIVAQTLQDYGVAVVVGDEQTYGKGTIQHQTVTQNKSNSFFKVTIGRYYAVSGKSTQIDGVKADIIVPSEYNFEELGEAFLDFPLPPDQMPAAFKDPLVDIDPFARKWFQKHYLPSLQPKQWVWTSMLPTLKENSHKRIEQNKNYQVFLKEIQQKVEPISEHFGCNDLQMEEAVNILKDMIFLSNQLESEPSNR